jgi:rhamnopyranosyl-N-acetylglucosaminyl-diphospho-decaprenol beta-1,3/1,4-galactofuranosyltransferase
VRPGTVAVTVAWNCRERVLALLAALRREGAPPVVVVDNGSADGTAAAVRERFPEAELVALRRNTGGAGGFAIGMRHALLAGAERLWLLDSDALPLPGCRAALERTFAPGVGAVAARIVTEEDPPRIQECGAMLHRLTGKPLFIGAGLPADAPLPAREVDYAAACCLMLDAAAVRRAGIFDPRWFIFFDDVEFCARLRRRGFAIRTAPDARATHPWHGAKPIAPWRAYYAVRNQIAYHLGHCSRPVAWMRSLYWTLYGLRIAGAAKRIAPAVSDAALHGIADGWGLRLGTRRMEDGTPLPAPISLGKIRSFVALAEYGWAKKHSGSAASGPAPLNERL